MSEVIIWDHWSVFLGGFAFCIFIIGSILYLKKGREKDAFNEKIVMFGYAGTLLCFALSIILLILFAFYLPGIYKDNAFYADVNRINFITKIIFKTAGVSFYFGYLFFALVFEINFKRSKYILTIIGVLLISLYILVPWQYVLIFGILAYFYTLILAQVVLITYTKWSHLEYRIISSYIVMGLVCIGWGIALVAMNITSEYISPFPIWVINLIFCLGGAFMIAPLFITVKNALRTITYSIIFNSFIISLQILFTVVFIYSGTPIYLIILTQIFTSIYVYIQYTTMKSIKSYFSEPIPSGVDESQLNVLETFVRPQRLTEEEVSISKEKKICLICKGKVLRFNSYICECDALYCEKCAKTLIDVENACWVCNAPFDKSKPVKLPEKDEEQIVVEKDDYKKGTSEVK